MIETTISNFIQVFIFQQSISWHFKFHTYKYCLQITVATLVKLHLNAANNFKMCYVALIMLRG